MKPHEVRGKTYSTPKTLQDRLRLRIYTFNDATTCATPANNTVDA